MKRLKFQFSYNTWTIILICLALPAFLINLGLAVFLEDESIRALVALEMDLSGNFIAPTLNGTFYHAKPPLYNWILYLSFTAFGDVSEWTARFPTLIFLSFFAWTIYYFSKKHLSPYFALLNAFSFVTCGRIIFWESMLGLIDMAYSLICFCFFMLIYRFFKKEKYYFLFLTAYILTAAGFLMKGFPSLVFLGISLLVLFFGWKKPRKLFSFAHLIGIICFGVIVGGYYFLYQQHQDVGHILSPLLDQATRRTPIAFKLNAVVSHIFAFPFEIIYHFLPWTILCVFLFSKNNLSLLLKDDFIRYCIFILFFNLLVYWISPQVYPRYLLMFIPLIFTSLWYLVERTPENWMHKIVRYIFTGLCVAMLPSVMLFYWFEIGDQVPFYELKLITCFFVLSCILVWILLDKKDIYFKFLAFILVLRMGFSLFVVPDKHIQNYALICKAEAYELAETYAKADLRLLGDSKVDYTSSFYISKWRNQPISRDYAEPSTGAYYFIDTMRISIPFIDSISETNLLIREHRRKLFLVKGEKVKNFSKK